MHEQSYLKLKYIPNRIASSNISKTSEQIESLKREFLSILSCVVECHVHTYLPKYIGDVSIEKSTDFIIQARELLNKEDKLITERTEAINECRKKMIEVLKNYFQSFQDEMSIDNVGYRTLIKDYFILESLSSSISTLDINNTVGYSFNIKTTLFLAQTNSLDLVSLFSIKRLLS